MDRSGPPKGNERRTGLFGGTFDPIHLGHLRCAQEVKEAFDLSQVIFILAATPPHKLDRPIISTRHRWNMVKEAIADNPCFTLSDVEIRREGASYSIETISSYHRDLKEGEKLFFILGADAFCEIETWKDYPQLFTVCDFIVISRPNFDPLQAPVLQSEGFTKEDPGDRFLHPSGHFLYLLRVTPIGISSTGIRRVVREGRSLSYLVPKEVEKYIAREGLYREVKHSL
ncbi:MAG: nicotinate (nicotinamide) nucleotide adenylyltransferase [Deltaproteobacteria bacterium RBG_16_54_11]|nr:MAG: nicotinate (nicotinamide) nucleotide adenylyltransferase [Deltaproteobacteria bacterium RBG_16_54_11]